MEYANEFIYSDFKVAHHEEVTALSNTVLMKVKKARKVIVEASIWYTTAQRFGVGKIRVYLFDQK